MFMFLRNPCVLLVTDLYRWKVEWQGVDPVYNMYELFVLLLPVNCITVLQKLLNDCITGFKVIKLNMIVTDLEARISGI